MFRDGMVSGSVLLSLTDADLEANGVSNSLHRRAIIFAIKHMADAHHAAQGGSSGSSSAMLQRSLSSSEANKPKFDVCAFSLMFSTSVYRVLYRCRILITNIEQLFCRPSLSSFVPTHSDAHDAIAAPVHCTKYRNNRFISYRRVGGADFAHLVKMYLKAAGYECFLDVENLGTGTFSLWHVMFWC